MNKFLRKEQRKYIFMIGCLIAFSFMATGFVKSYDYNVPSLNEDYDATSKIAKDNEVKDITEEQLFEKLVFALKNLDEEKISEVVSYNTNFDINSEYQNLMTKAYSILAYEVYEKEGSIYVKGKHSNITSGIDQALEEGGDISNSLVLYYKKNPIEIRKFDFVIEEENNKLKLSQELLELITCGFY